MSFLCSTQESKSYWFETTWGWVNYDRFFYFGVNYPFKAWCYVSLILTMEKYWRKPKQEIQGVFMCPQLRGPGWWDSDIKPRKNYEEWKKCYMNLTVKLKRIRTKSYKYCFLGAWLQNNEQDHTLGYGWVTNVVVKSVTALFNSLLADQACGQSMWQCVDLYAGSVS